MMDKNIFAFIVRHSKKEQALITAVTFVSFPMLYSILMIPKEIINLLQVDPSEQREIFGTSLDTLEYMLALCGVFLALILANGLLKMGLNTLKGRVGERLVWRLRHRLLQRLLRFPLGHFQDVSQGELSSSVVAEVDPLASFFGEAIAQPLFQVGTMATVLVFMFMQDPLLGGACVAIVPVQAYIVPKLQYQVKLLGKERVQRARKLAEAIGETTETIREIRTNGTQDVILAMLSDHLARIFRIRLSIYKKKYFVKFLNNTLNQITPFLFYSVGGYLVLAGDLTLGALVAAIAAHKEFVAPWKELLVYYQNGVDSQIKYAQVVEHYSPRGLLEPAPDVAPHPDDLRGPITLEGVTWSNEYGDRIIDHVSLTIDRGTFVGISGTNPLGLRRLAELLVGLEAPDGGRVTIAGHTLSAMPPTFVGRRIAYAGPEPKLVAGTIMQNVTYGLRHLRPDGSRETAAQKKPSRVETSGSTGDEPVRIDDPLIDVQSVGAESWNDLADWWIQCLKVLGDDTSTYREGLRQTFDPAHYPHFAAPLLRARFRLHRKLRQAGLTGTIAWFRRSVFDDHAPLYETLLFGLPAGGALTLDTMAEHPALAAVLDRHGLRAPAIALGHQMAEHLINTYRTDPDESRIVRHPHLTEAKYRALHRAVVEADPRFMTGRPRDASSTARFIEVFLWIVPARDSGVTITEDLRRRILAAQAEILDHPPEGLRGAIVHFQARRYHPRLSVVENLLFGRLTSEEPRVIKTLKSLIDEALREEHAHTIVMFLLTLSPVGVGGSRLTVLMKQKLQYLRALMKRPDIIVCHQALDALERSDRAAIFAKTRRLLPATTLIVLEQWLPDEAAFDTVATLRKGRLVLENSAADADLSETMPMRGGAKRDDDAQRAVALTPLFADLPRQTRLRIAADAEWRTVSPGEFVFRAGEAAEYVFILVEGQAEQVLWRQTETPIHVAYMFPPQTVGETEVLAGTRRFSGVRAVTGLRVLRVNGAVLSRLASANPSLALRALQNAANRLASELPKTSARAPEARDRRAG